MAGLFESKESKEGIINPHIRPDFEEALSSITSALLGKIDTLFQVFQAGNNEIHGNTEVQSSSGGLTEELGEGKEQQQQPTVFLESKMDALQNKEQEILGADETLAIRILCYKVQPAVKELLPEEVILLQKFYNMQSQKMQDYIGVKKGRGIRVKKRVRKKEKKKDWRQGK